MEKQSKHFVEKESKAMKDFYETNSYDREPTETEKAKGQADAEKADKEDE